MENLVPGDCETVDLIEAHRQEFTLVLVRAGLADTWLARFTERFHERKMCCQCRTDTMQRIEGSGGASKNLVEEPKREQGACRSTITTMSLSLTSNLQRVRT